MRLSNYFLCALICILCNTTLLADTAVNPTTLSTFENDFSEMCKYQHFSGAVLIAVEDKIIFKKACGFANRNFKVNNTLETKFNLGSVGKIFTSVAIAQLVEQHKITLETPASEILKTWLPSKPTKQITLEQLLIHTSGLKNFMDNKRWRNGADDGQFNETKDYKSLLLEDPLLFQPGKSQYYSNNGYILLGAAIEALSKTSYIKYIKSEILKPADMLNTDISRLDEATPNRADGYYYFCNKGTCIWKNNNFSAPFSGTSAGGIYSTVDDLYKFSQALHQHKLLNPAYTNELLSSNIVRPSNDISVDIAIKPYKVNNIEIPENFSPYGFAGAWNKYGFAVWEQPSLVGHTGGTAGVSAFFATSPDGRYTIIILSNVSGSGPILLYKKIRLLLGFTPEIVNY
ncbi:MAG: serine hydrolase [Gammaproteobacteria bacterium]|nr:serine hydrolase [Gammaproteobacteria bacterium]